LLGSRSARYGRTVTTVDANDRLVLVLGHHGHDEASLSKELSRPNRKTRIHLNENLSRTFLSGLVAVLKPQVADSHAGSDAEAVRNYLTSATASHAGPVTLSVEVGHVHADRELGPIQERGIDLGGLLAREISAVNRTRAAGCAIDVEVVPMIDDDHVVNRLSYSRYQGILANKGVPAAEIVLESSPIILDIACDLLKTAVRGDGRGYILENRGDNLYLESGALRLELVESTDQEMRVGCIVYDTALTVYRSARAQMQELFRARTGHLGNVHQEMIDTYDSLAHPQERAEYRQRLDKLWKKPFSSIIAEPATPYLDAYRDVQRKRAVNGQKLIVLNILEDYYEPLELKVRQLAELLGVDISLDCLLFSPYGAGLRSIDD
jgi:hypothetical protein